MKRTKLKLPYLRFSCSVKAKNAETNILLELESRILRVTRTKSSRHIFFFTPGLCLTESTFYSLRQRFPHLLAPWCGVANTCTPCIRVSLSLRLRLSSKMIGNDRYPAAESLSQSVRTIQSKFITQSYPVRIVRNIHSLSIVIECY